MSVTSKTNSNAQSRGPGTVRGGDLLRRRGPRRHRLARPIPIADGVWLVRGGVPVRSINVYLIRQGDGLVAFDAGTSPMATPIKAMVGPRLRRIVLGHAHADHRGGARGLGAPVYCHAAEAPDVEGDAGERYFDHGGEGCFGVRGLPVPFARYWLPAMMGYWDGGPVEVAGTLGEGDEIAGFEVVELPGHSPGSIALWRAADRLVLTSDCFYTFGLSWPVRGEPRVPTEHYNYDGAQARRSILKLAALEPAAAWPGHMGPVLGEVRSRLERAASDDA
jgi:hydroxyacylglutathione hydrolase